MYDFSKRKVLITGSSRGIGKKIAEDFISLGAEVLITGTNESVLSSVKKELGPKCHSFPCDFFNPKEIEMLINKASDKLGSVDTLVNNAGITRDSLFLRMSMLDWQEVISVNLNSVMKLSQMVIKPMIKNRFGRIVNISSIVGTTGNPGQANYSAAKAGLVGFSKSLALEVASRGITVNNIAPGYIQTDMTNKLTDKQKEAILERIPARKLGVPADVSDLAIFLSSSRANYITGQTFHINGGMAMP